MIVDQATLRDLEIFRTSSGGAGVFDLVDFTRTSTGSAALRARMSEPLSDPDAIRAHHDCVAFLNGHGLAFPSDESRVSAVERYLASNIQVTSRESSLGMAAEGSWLAIRYGDVLREVRAGTKATGRLLQDLEAYVGRVQRLDPPGVLRDLCVGVRELIQDEEINRAVTAAGAPGAVLRADRTLRLTRRAEVDRLVLIVAELDMLHSMAEASARLGLSRPEVVGGGAFSLEADGLVHPFLDKGVPNPLVLTPDRGALFLTGPNMAGKTTYLKSAAVALLLAQTGMGVPARRFRFVPVDALLTSIHTEDDLQGGLSYYMAEVRRVRDAAEILASGQRAFVVFDEIFKGTNVMDALEASELVIRGFARAAGSGFLFASHLTELARSLANEPALRFSCFEGEIGAQGATYRYVVKEGVSEQRFGIHLLERERIPELLARIDGLRERRGPVE